MAGQRAFDADTLIAIAGKPVGNARGYIYQFGTTTPLAGVYADETGGAAITTVDTDAFGHWELWHDTPRLYTILWTDHGGTAYYADSPGLTRSFASRSENREADVPTDAGAQTDEAQTWTAAQTFQAATNFDGAVDFDGAVNVDGDTTFTGTSAVQVQDKTSVTNVALRDPGPTIYLSATNGNDANDGKSAGTPKLTWAAAIAALTGGAAIFGRIVAVGDFTITAPVVIGDGSKFIGLVVEGSSASGLSGSLSQTIVRQTTVNVDGFQFSAPASKAHYLVWRGVDVRGPGEGLTTGVGMNFAPAGGSQWIDPLIENCNVGSFGESYRIGGSINFTARKCVSESSVVGYRFTTSSDALQPNLPYLDQCTAQNGTHAVVIDTQLAAPKFDNFISQNNSGADWVFNAGTRGGTWQSCWWEFPGSDMLQLVEGGGSLGPLDDATFVTCQFDASGNARNVFHLTGGTGDGCNMNGVTLINCRYLNHSTGKLIVVDNGTPVGATDPGFMGLTIIGGYYPGLGANSIQGAFSATLQPRRHNTILGANMGTQNSALFGNAATPVIFQTASGGVRFFNVAPVVSNNQWLKWRNAADGADTDVLFLSSGDIVQLKGSTVSILTTAATAISMAPNSSTVAQFLTTGLTMTAAKTIITAAASATVAGLRLGHGTAPSSPADGDMWTTTAGLFVRINGVTVGPLS